MKTASAQLQLEVVEQYCKQLRMHTAASQYRRLAETAVSQQQTHFGYLEALLAADGRARTEHHSAATQRSTLAEAEDAR